MAEDIRPQTDAVVLVGHSQGAELSRRAALDGGVDECVWVGSGETPLGLVRTLRRSRLVGPLITLALLASPIALAWYMTHAFHAVVAVLAATVETVRAWIDPSAPKVEDSTIVRIIETAFAEAGASLAILVGASVLFAIISRLAHHPDDTLEQPPCEVIVVKSILDPVSLGPVPDHAVLRYVPADPRHIWREHIAYFEKSETGLAVLEACFGTPIREHDPPYVLRSSKRVVAVSYVVAIICLASTWGLGTLLVSLIPT